MDERKSGPRRIGDAGRAEPNFPASGKALFPVLENGIHERMPRGGEGAWKHDLGAVWRNVLIGRKAHESNKKPWRRRKSLPRFLFAAQAMHGEASCLLIVIDGANEVINHLALVGFGEMGVDGVVAVQNEMAEIDDFRGGVIVVTEQVIQRDMEELRDFSQRGEIRLPLPAFVSVVAHGANPQRRRGLRLREFLMLPDVS